MNKQLPSNLSQLGITICGTIYYKYRHYYKYGFKKTLCKRKAVYRHTAGGNNLNDRPICPECELRIIHCQTEPEGEV